MKINTKSENGLGSNSEVRQYLRNCLKNNCSIGIHFENLSFTWRIFRLRKSGIQLVSVSLLQSTDWQILYKMEMAEKVEDRNRGTYFFTIEEIAKRLYCPITLSN